MKTTDETAATFFDGIAADYDLMTNFENRFAKETPFYRLLVERHRIRTALDAGCGTGFHSLLLASLGVEVTAVDVSTAMLARLKEHAEARKLPVRAIRCSFSELPGTVTENFDAVFCLGNTLPTLGTVLEVNEALRAFGGLLKPGGMLFIQLVNFRRIINRHDIIQSVREAGGKIFVRFYEPGEERLTFNLLTIERTGGELRSALRSSKHLRLEREELVASLSAAGFGSIEIFGTIRLDQFDEERSSDLVLLSHR
jgi:ubiquinone/menaquinone biosynthesis C-methylase UbiE